MTSDILCTGSHSTSYLQWQTSKGQINTELVVVIVVVVVVVVVAAAAIIIIIIIIIINVVVKASCIFIAQINYRLKKLHGLSPRANYTDRATAACRRSDCQLLRKEGATWSA
jgi:hypothetical protein